MGAYDRWWWENAYKMIIAYIGKMRSGKTYAMTERVLRELNRGRVVYTNYRINWNPEEPMPSYRLFLHKLGLKKNWSPFRR